jgi:thiol-disulfide isomerase/thioredoxin
MRHAWAIVLVAAFGLRAAAGLPGSSAPTDGAAAMELKLPESELRENGAFGFPQKEAAVLCDTSDLRLSIWNNSDYLYAEAVLWQDNDPSLGKTDDGRTIGDNSELLFLSDSSAKLTPKVDRDYMLNPWPGMSGMYYQVKLAPGTSTGIKSDTQGQGAIRYIKTPDETLIRVDVYVIPLTELSKHVLENLRVCYYGSSPVPALTVNSAGFSRDGRHYYGYHIPGTNYETDVFINGKKLDLDAVPDGRHDPSLAAPRHPQPMPHVGTVAPEISAKDWLNTEASPTLASLHGKTVLVEFWATWCGPCIESIPHLTELQKRYGDKGFKILSFTEQNRPGVETFLKRTPMAYTIGLESDDTFDRYGVTGIPQAFLVDESGKIVWEGSSDDKSLDGAIQSALKQN